MCCLRRRYYKETDGLKLDVGVYMKALEVQDCRCALIHEVTIDDKISVHGNNDELLFPFFCSLQYACDLEAEVIGKPSPMFFQSVLTDMGLQPHEVRSNR